MEHINLNGPDGNVFYLMGMARKLAKELGLDGADIVKQMMAGNYGHALDVFEKYFGHVVKLEGRG